MKTMFITGASSGIGRETVKLFLEKGWQVAATMRNPQDENEFANVKGIKLLKCDVTKYDDIKRAVKESILTFGKIDVIINNAGFYTIGPFEAATNSQISQQLDTNLKGVMIVTKEFLPYLRKNKSGVIINISSIAGLMAMPIQSLYHASKWGIEGFSEALQYELRPFGIRVKIIEPGVIKTDFYGRSKTVVSNENTKEYDEYSNKVIDVLIRNGQRGSSAEKVAETIYAAATDNKDKIRYRVGKLQFLPTLKRFLPQKIYTKLVSINMER